jgi:hypothetical protein
MLGRAVIGWVLTIGLMGWAAPAAFAQGFSRGDRLFLNYMQTNNARVQRQMQQQQQSMNKQLQRLNSQVYRGPTGNDYVDPADDYLRQAETGRRSSRPQTQVPPIYGGRQRNLSTFNQHYRYFNPQRSPLY